MASLTSKLILELIDRVSGPASAISGRLSSITALQTRNAAALAATSQKLFVAGAAAYGMAKTLQAPVSAASAFETAMLNIAQKADLSDEAMAKLGNRIRELAPIVNKSALEVAKGMDTLVGFGLDPERAEALLAPIGRAATAYQAEVDDLAKAGFSALDNLKVKTDEFGKALDVMAQSGKEGAFELKDMATYFPQLTAAAQALGMTGVTAVGRLSAALQIARKGASDGSAAATNTKNLMQKIISPETTKKFKELGIDIRKELDKTKKSGGDIFEMIARLTEKAVKGDLSKIGDLFQDAQVQDFLRPLIQNIGEYRRIRDEALKATGVVDKDFARRMLTNAAQVEAFKIQVNDLSISIGNALLPNLNLLLTRLRPVVKSFEQFARNNPGLVSGVTSVAAGLIGLRLAMLATKVAGLWMWGGALAIAKGALLGLAGAAWLARSPLMLIGVALRAARSAMLGFAGAAAILGSGGALKLAGAALLALLNPIRLVRAALVALRFAMLGTGIGAVLLGIGAAGMYIYKNWSKIKELFSGFGEGFMAEIGFIKPALTPLMGWLDEVKKKISSVLNPQSDKDQQKNMRNAGNAAGRSVGRMARDIITSLSSIDNWGQLGETVGTGLSRAVVKGFRAATGLLKSIDWSGLGSAIGSGVANIDWAGIGMSALRLFGAAIKASGQVLYGVIRGLIMGAFNVDIDAVGRALINQIVEGIRAGITAVSTIASEIGSTISSNASALFSAGSELMQQLWEGMKAKVAALLGWVAGIGGRIRSAISGAAAAVSGGGGGGGAVDGARAAGGPVGAGRTYLVGERGPELFRPRIPGSIVPAMQTARLLSERSGGSGGGGNRTVSAPTTNNVTINVSGSPGQSAAELAREIKRQLSDELNALSRGAYSDGAYA
ncbi:phage tail tape measure protein [Rhodopseudomonas palustris]|uniref:phage tail tape measure protein n=1 Tax=Rhodopseudomonas palustris TaxID=1076 RepID=UPI0021F398A4|nr:phage tail tape measure protein [Rhodopseudomonas palustris]UYO55706.1 phage tail tape measure protein [Rhodopseudomonas palustris]